MPHTTTKINIPWQRVVHVHSMIYLHDHDDSVKASYASYGIFINYSGFIINKKCFRNIYAPLGAKFKITSYMYNHLLIEGNPCTMFGIDQVKDSKDIEWTTQWAEKSGLTLTLNM